jgi:hypothetical protein
MGLECVWRGRQGDSSGKGSKPLRMPLNGKIKEYEKKHQKNEKQFADG